MPPLGGASRARFEGAGVPPVRCAVCPSFPIEHDDNGVDGDDNGGNNDDDDENVDDNYCDGDVVMVMSRPTLQPAPPAALSCSSPPPLHSSSKHFRNLAPPVYRMRMMVVI